MRAVGHRNETKLLAKFDRLHKQWPSWTGTAARLRKSGLEPTSAIELYVAEDSRASWVVLAKPADALAQQFELAPEVVVLCTPWPVMQAKDIERTEAIFKRELRVDPGFALVISGDPGAESRLRAVLPEHRKYVFLDAETFATGPDNNVLLRDLLRETLGRRRLFDMRTPATESQFFGRENELEALERDVLSGHCLGVFGLRKVGKTSLLRRLAEKFRDTKPEARRVIPVEVDLQQISFNRRNLAGAVALVGHHLDREVERANIKVPSVAPDPLDRLVQTVEHVERELGARVVLMLDEYEVLLGGRMPAGDGVELLTWLRGVAQGHATAFSLVLAGRNSRLLAPARIGGVDNPMYRFLRSFPLAGLTPDDCHTLVRKIGGRMALRFSDDALQLMVEETGGHPGLVRTLGHLIDQDIPLPDRNPAVVNAATVKGVLPKFSREVDQDMRELLDAANDFDLRASDYLVHLAHEIPWIGGASEARIDDALVAYGILTCDTHAFRIGRLATWIRENYACPQEAAHG
jgi:hypothetical protein